MGVCVLLLPYPDLYQLRKPWPRNYLPCFCVGSINSIVKIVDFLGGGALVWYGAVPISKKGDQIG